MDLVYESGTCRRLRLVLDALPIGSAVEESESRLLFLGILESFLPEVLEQVFEWWKSESLDGVMPFRMRKTAARELELSGLCILIGEQSVIPIHVRLRHAEHFDQIDWLDCRIGEAGPGSGGMTRIKWPNWHRSLDRLQREADARIAEMPWAFQVIKSGHKIAAH